MPGALYSEIGKCPCIFITKGPTAHCCFWLFNPFNIYYKSDPENLMRAHCGKLALYLPIDASQRSDWLVPLIFIKYKIFAFSQSESLMIQNCATFAQDDLKSIKYHL